MNIYEKSGIRPIINATGTVTRLGGALMEESVLEAMREASQYSVSMEELHSAASQKISEQTLTEAALVTTGASSALTLGTAAIIAGLDLPTMSQIPGLAYTPEFLVAQDQRTSYDRAITITGAKLVNVGVNDIISGAGVRGVELWEYGQCQTNETVGLLYTVNEDFDESHLNSVVKWAHQENLKVIVDAAASLPPVDHLQRIPGTGADLVCFSGGKAIGGPQSTGILCGSKKLITSAMLQLLDWDEHWDLWNPSTDFLDKNELPGMPRHGFGRGMKVGKEEIIGLLKALELFTQDAVESKKKNCLDLLKQITTEVNNLPVQCEIIHNPGGYPVLNIQLDHAQSQMNAFELCSRLREGSPRIFPGHGKLKDNIIQINPSCLKTGDQKAIIQRLNEELN